MFSNRIEELASEGEDKQAGKLFFCSLTFYLVPSQRCLPASNNLVKKVVPGDAQGLRSTPAQDLHAFVLLSGLSALPSSAPVSPSLIQIP